MQVLGNCLPSACEEQGALKGTGAAELCAADKGQRMWFRLFIPLLSLPSRRALSTCCD